MSNVKYTRLANAFPTESFHRRGVSWCARAERGNCDTSLAPRKPPHADGVSSDTNKAREMCQNSRAKKHPPHEDGASPGSRQQQNTPSRRRGVSWLETKREHSPHADGGISPWVSCFNIADGFALPSKVCQKPYKKCDRYPQSRPF